MMKKLVCPDILDVLQDYNMPIKQVGNNYFTTCLWHNDSNPSLAIYPQTNSFYCFVCKKSGTVENLIAKLDHKTYAQVVKMLYGDNYAFRKLGEDIKEVEPNNSYMLETLSKEIRCAIQSNKLNIDRVPGLIKQVISTKLDMAKFKSLLEDIRNECQ